MTETQAPARRQTDPELATERAGVLRIGDQFRLKLSGEEGNWSVFFFHGVVYSPRGIPSVSAHGGDASPDARRQWHAFAVDRVAEQAEPAGKMAMKRVTA